MSHLHQKRSGVKPKREAVSMAAFDAACKRALVGKAQAVIPLREKVQAEFRRSKHFAGKRNLTTDGTDGRKG